MSKFFSQFILISLLMVISSGISAQDYKKVFEIDNTDIAWYRYDPQNLESSYIIIPGKQLSTYTIKDWQKRSCYFEKFPSVVSQQQKYRITGYNDYSINITTKIARKRNSDLAIIRTNIYKVQMDDCSFTESHNNKERSLIELGNWNPKIWSSLNRKEYLGNVIMGSQYLYTEDFNYRFKINNFKVVIEKLENSVYKIKELTPTNGELYYVFKTWDNKLLILITGDYKHRNIVVYKMDSWDKLCSIINEKSTYLFLSQDKKSLYACKNKDSEGRRCNKVNLETGKSMNEKLPSTTQMAHFLYYKYGNSKIGRISESYSYKVNKGILEIYEFSKNIVQLTDQKFPQLKIEDIRFIDHNADNCINAMESDTIKFKLSNYGDGPAYNVKVITTEKMSLPYLDVLDVAKSDVLRANESIYVSIPVTGSMNLPDDTALFEIKAMEANGFDSDPVMIQIETKRFKEPNIEIIDYKLTSSQTGKVFKGSPETLTVAIQNTGKSTAENVSIIFTLPDNVFTTSDKELFIASLMPGESKVIEFEFFTNKRFNQEKVTIGIKTNEKYNKFGDSEDILIPLAAGSPGENRYVIQPQASNKDVVISTISLTPDVDKNIPLNKKNPNIYALVIGNQDYSSYQTNLSSEVNVDYAINDADIFRDYLISTLGAPEKNVYHLSNATFSQILQYLTKLETIAEIKEGEAELFFYYSGHGFPDENTKEPYLIPVDASATNLESAIKLEDVYKKLTNYSSKRIIAIIDACFSGGGRNKGLLAMKSVKIKPSAPSLNGNLVVFSSSTGEESSGVYREKQHGMFTYYFLKKLQESAGDISIKELANYIQEKVELESVIINNKRQTPQVLYSPDVEGDWETWRLVE